MKKRGTHWILLLLLAALMLTSCGGNQTGQTPTGEPTSSPSADPTPSQSVDPTPSVEPTPSADPSPSAEPNLAEVFYFVNSLEYNRLYRCRADGTDLTLVLDEACYSAQQVGDTVYFRSGTDLVAYDIPTGERHVVVKGATDYQVAGNRLAYTVEAEGVFVRELRCRDMSTGEEFSLGKMELTRFALGEEYLYYSCYRMDAGYDTLNAYHLESGTDVEITRDFHSYYALFPVEDGVYLRAAGVDKEGWYFISPEDGSMESQPWLSNQISQIIDRTDEGFLCLRADYSGVETPSVHRITPEGEDTLLAAARTENSAANLALTPAGEGQWLMKEFVYSQWGEMNDMGYYDRYGTQVFYRLLSADGTVVELNAAGEAGALFPAGDFPVIDSSTARKPVTTALYNLFVFGYGYEGALPICSTTHGAWLNIADRKVDLALLAAPTEEEQAYLKEKGVEVEMKLYGGDGLVFIGNSANPVTNLTHRQILAIYRGEITNWSELGGPDHPISVYFRDDQSGSQRLFESLVFKGEEIPNFHELNFGIMDEMSSIVDIMLVDPYGIGYSIMTYLDEVYAVEDLKVFSVDGVAPSTDTVRDRSYRYHTQGYVVIRADEPEDSPTRRLYNWFGCPVSDDLLRNCSVSPLKEG